MIIIMKMKKKTKRFFGRKSKVVPMTQQSQAIKMVISQPTTFRTI